MKKNQIIALVAVLVVLAVVYGVLSVSNRKAEEREQAREESEIVQVTDLGEIASFSYEAPEQETLHFKKKEDSWICTDDKKVELDQTYPDQIADTFASLTASREMEDIDALEEYGLEEPAYTVTLQPEDGEETVIKIGNSTGGTEYYLLIEGKEELVYTVDSSDVETLNYSLEDMEQEEETEETDETEESEATEEAEESDS